jgi:hypothetical protein
MVSRGTITGKQLPKRPIINDEPELKPVKHLLNTSNWKELLKRIIHRLFYYYAICYNNKMHN